MSPSVCELEIAVGDGAGDFLQRADFRPRQPDALEPVGAGADDRLRRRPDRTPRPAGPRSRRRWRSRAAATPLSKPSRQSRRSGAAAAAGRACAISAAKRGSAASAPPGRASRSASVWMSMVMMHRRSGIVSGDRMTWHSATTVRSSPMPDPLISMANVNTYTRVLRFAPSPNGYLHLGHAYSALLNHDMARERGGRLLLRIEDIDAAALAAGIRGGDLRGPRLARHLLAGAGAAAERAFRRLRDRAAQARRAGPDLSELREPRRDRGAGRRARAARPLAARSRRRAALSGRGRKLAAAERKRRIEAGEPYALRLAIDAAVAQTGVLTWSETGRGPHDQTGIVTAAPPIGATSSWRARKCRPAIISPSSSTMRCRA